MATTAPIRIPIVGDDKFTKKWKGIAKTVSKVGASMQRVGQASTRFVTLPLLAAGTAAAKVGSDFDFAMRKVEAKATITGKSIGDLRNQAKELGRTTVHTAREVAGAQEKLAMAGWDSLQVFEALPSVLSLSTATSTELIQTADIASNVMQTFGLRAEESGRVADVFATIVAGANVDMEMLAETMKYAGPISKAFGTSMEDTAAAAGFLGNMGIQGSMAGTALQNMMVRLAAPTGAVKNKLKKMGVEVADSSGNIRNLNEILGDLSKSMQTMGGQERLAVIEKIFGRRAMKAATPAIADIGKMDSNLQNLSKTLAEIKPGKAAEMVAIMTGGSTGAFKRFTSALEGMAIAFAESGLLDTLAIFATRAADLFQQVSELSPETRELGLKIAAFAAAAGPAILIVGKIVSGVGSLISVVVGAGGLTGVLAAVTGPVGIAIGSIALLTGAVIYLWDEIEPIRTAFAEEIPAAFSISSDEAGNTASVFSSLGETVKALTEAFAPIAGVLVRIGVRLNPVVLWFKAMKVFLTPAIFIAKHLFRVIAWGAGILKDQLEPRLQIAKQLFIILKNKVLDFLGPVGDVLRQLGAVGDKMDELTGGLGAGGGKTGVISIPKSDIEIPDTAQYAQSDMFGLNVGPQMSFEPEILEKIQTNNRSETKIKIEDNRKIQVEKIEGELEIETDTGALMQGAL
jgi:TP901 family phage tail tape measure protein